MNKDKKKFATTIYNRSTNNGNSNFYSKIDNRLIKSEELSLLAKGIMCYILSQNDTFTIHKATVRKDLNTSKELPLGKKNFNKAWRELEDNGYVLSQGQMKDEEGKFKGKNYIINEHPDNYKPNLTLDEQGQNDSEFIKRLWARLSNPDGTLRSLGEGTDDKVPGNNDQVRNNNQLNHYTGTTMKNFSIDWSEINDDIELRNLNQEIIEAFECNDWGDDYSIWSHACQFSSEEVFKKFMDLSSYNKVWAHHLYNWTLFVNARHLKVNIANWRMSSHDLELIKEAMMNIFQETTESAVQIMNTMFDHGMKSKLPRVPLSYLLKQFTF